MINPHNFGPDVVDNVTDIVADHINNLRAWLAYSAILGLNSNTETLTADKTLIDGDHPLQFIDPTADEYCIELPAVGAANHIFFVINTSASFDLQVEDDGAVEVVAIGPGKTALIVSDGNEWRLAATTNDSAAILEGGGDVLGLGSISDGQFLKRSGEGIVGVSSVASKTQKRVATHIVFDLVGPFPFETGNSRGRLPIPADLAGWKLTDIEAVCAGCTTKYQIQINNGSNDLLTTKLQIDAGTTHSKDAATQPVINNSYNTMAEGMILDVDADAGVGTGLVIMYTFIGELD
jgi:hypothetical protein